jgi:hypothetical protein
MAQPLPMAASTERRQHAGAASMVVEVFMAEADTADVANESQAELDLNGDSGWQRKKLPAIFSLSYFCHCLPNPVPRAEFLLECPVVEAPQE